MKSADQIKYFMGAVVHGTIILFLYPLIIRWLWNMLLPDFGIQTITYWQAFGLRFLVTTLAETPKYVESVNR